MQKVGEIKEIWRYPVKGMSGEKVARCYLDQAGLSGDRLFAVRDAIREEIQSCKFRPGLLSCVAQYTQPDAKLIEESFEVLFPDGVRLSSDSVDMNRKISHHLGHASTLESLRPKSETDFYKRHKQDDHTWLEELKATFEREAGEPLPDFSDLDQDFIDYVTQLGSFFLVSPFHIISTASVEYLKQLDPESDWDMRRFRPNIVVETMEGGRGLVEQGWVGKKVRIGHTTINCSSPAPRCGAVTRALQGAEANTAMLRTIVKHAQQNLGVYGEIEGEDIIRVGDAVYLL